MVNNKDNMPGDKSATDMSKTGDKKVIGEGMNSLDSTQVPLKTETGEPDWDAVKGGKAGYEKTHGTDKS